MTPRHVILHCSDTEDGGGLDAVAIRRYHVEHNGWEDIGYHYVVERVGVDGGGLIVTPGRPPHVAGAHCKAAGRNHDSLGVCVVGTFDELDPSPYLVADVARFVATLCFTFGIAATDVRGHAEFEPAKTCPGRLWPMEYTRALVASHLRADSPWGPHLRLDLMRLP